MTHSSHPAPYTEIDGRTPTAPEMHAVLPQLTSGYGHFTAAQVRDGRVRGLDLHLARLTAGTRELFGADLDGERIRELLRHALAGAGVRDASARVHVYGSGYGPDVPLTVVITIRPPMAPPVASLSLLPVPYLRPVPHVKHLGSFAQTYYTLLAERQGHDSALLTGPDGEISEGAVTNIVFHDGSSLVWPDSPALHGITQALLERHLPAAGPASVRRPVTLADLPAYRAAFVTNSHGIAAVHRIGDTEFPVDAELLKTLTEVHDSAPWDAV
ncbi:aminotransferase class IV [Streptomyces candidus]|uniref:Branched-subunit amino acid aminotransferase/4-amino-4-deoxychorismate lyase n=1 Tax=Streptomyces candidus TaxID=67283 RepID=A0A7X0LMM7_9ACTN|nr:aminotransferase class IV [Streptomyces candidus]MBB6434040.1 branched-subunit amino acid aminotransferase/4-amino-4-deoxychorismate lyase [Streptomyces candidus]GHH33568.1 hypothetical protein GCM10018773_04310 [Streptomyces candidus]